MPDPGHILAIVGPTGSGKSSLGIEIAEAVGGEIIGADSRQVYRYMDIGTAKPTDRDRSRVPHHLIDLIDPNEKYSLALFVRQARETIDEVLARRKVPIVVGGTGQYIWALLEGWNVPNVPPDNSLRAFLQERLEHEGLGPLVNELEAKTPSAALRVDKKNPRRVVRALELAYQSSYGEFQSASRTPPPFYATIIGLTLPRADLYERINLRADTMIEAGWVREVEKLIRMRYGPELPSMSSLGYRDLTEFLEGDRTLEDAVDTVKKKTRRFARRQYAWFRFNDERIRWFESTRGGFDEAMDYAEASLGVAWT